MFQWRKIFVTLAVVVLVSGAVGIAAVVSGGGDSTLPARITPESECPVAGCASEEGCHIGAEPPEPQEGQIMRCPKVGCEASECHALERLVNHYQQPESMSLYLWIVVIPAIIILMFLITRRK